jgi:signal peptidase I
MQKTGRFLLWTAIILGIIVGIARVVAIRWWRVPEGDLYLDASIAPTLRGGDLVILWRLTKPHLGDLVVCPEPKAPNRVVIGRIIGEGGDKVQIEGQRLSVNGRQAETELACDPRTFTVTHPNSKKELQQNCDIEAIAGTSHMRGGTAGHSVMPPPADTRVPEGKVFLLSDNRLLPYDSRDFGVVDRDTCTESVVFRIVSHLGYSDAPRRMTYIQ